MSSGSILDELLTRVSGMDPAEYSAASRELVQQTKDMVWFPQPGPQTDAYLCQADELYYGGQAGGGKTDLIIGLALTAHTNSLLLRRIGKDAVSLMDRTEQVIGNTDGRNLSTKEWKRGDGKLEFGGCENEADKERRKGIPHDLKAFDEIGDFSEGQFRFIKAWTRSAKPGQRSRVVCTGNPPTNPEGLWVIEYWAPWLDPRHPNPAKSGELRWFISDEEAGKDKEVSGPGKYPLLNEDGSQRFKDDGTPDTVIARSRTFIRAKLSDNKYYGDDYAAVLDGLPKELRAAYRDGRFDLSLKDNLTQTIPTSWVMAAIERRRKNPKPPTGVPMCALGVDPTGGGSDEFTIAPRYDGWYADIIAIPGKQVPLGSDMAAQVIKARRDQAMPIVDCGGGYGGGIIQTLGEIPIEYKVHKGSQEATTRDKSGQLKFKNKRSEVIWRFREALDPDQMGGSIIELPDDARLIADLTAPTFVVRNGCIVVESKEDVCDRLKRSTDRGDSVVIAWSGGLKGIEVAGGWQEYGGPGSKKLPKVILGHQSQRRR